MKLDEVSQLLHVVIFFGNGKMNLWKDRKWESQYFLSDLLAKFHKLRMGQTCIAAYPLNVSMLSLYHIDSI